MLMDDIHIALRCEQIEDVMDGAQSRAGENVHVRQVEQKVLCPILMRLTSAVKQLTLGMTMQMTTQM